jgi:hypothetical protein
MSVKSLRAAAANRASYHSGSVAAEKSPYARLRRALEWVMAEARAVGRDDVDKITETVTRVARDLNERSRP